MYILYLDESGEENSPRDRYFVLGGVAVFERQTFHLSRELDQIQARYLPGMGAPVLFHAESIRHGKRKGGMNWRAVDRELKTQILRDMGSVIRNASPSGLFLFAAAVEKSDDRSGLTAVRIATEQVARRFDLHLGRRYRRQNPEERQAGLIVFSEGRFHERARVWVQESVSLELSGESSGISVTSHILRPLKRRGCFNSLTMWRTRSFDSTSTGTPL